MDIKRIKELNHRVNQTLLPWERLLWIKGYFKRIWLESQPNNLVMETSKAITIKPMHKMINIPQAMPPVALYKTGPLGKRSIHMPLEQPLTQILANQIIWTFISMENHLNQLKANSIILWDYNKQFRKSMVINNRERIV